jgi:hypothetical protein
MKLTLTLVLLTHAAIHLIGLARKPRATGMVTSSQAWLWLVAASCFAGAAVLLHCSPGWWGLVTLLGIGVSSVAIVGRWAEAQWGLLVSGLLLLPAVPNMLELLPSSLPSRYAHERDTTLAQQSRSRVIEAAELDALPLPVQRYLQRVGVVGRPAC